MKVLLSMSTEPIFPHTVQLRANHEEYAVRSGYTYRHQTELHWPDIAASFSKLSEIREALGAGFDTVIWSDIDVGFTDMTVDIGNLVDDQHWLAGYRQRNLTRDFICCGLMVIRNCDQSRRFFAEIFRQVDDHFADRKKKVLDMYAGREYTDEEYRYDLWMRHPWEQDYVDTMLTNAGYAGVRQCNERQIGCFSRELWHDGVPWYPGCPTVHITGTPDWAKRSEVWKNYIPLVKR